MQPRLDARTLKQFPGPEVPGRCSDYVVWPEHRRPKPAERSVVNWLLAQAGQAGIRVRAPGDPGGSVLTVGQSPPCARRQSQQGRSKAWSSAHHHLRIATSLARPDLLQA